ncbi:MAG: hypothetical protein ACT4P2_15295 [Pseudomonadota bacterium]
MLHWLANLVPMLTWKPDATQAYGLGGILAYSDLKADFATLPAFAQTRGRLRRDTANGAGLRLGGMWDLGKEVTLGATAAT